MKVFINKICTVHFDKQPDGNYSAVTGKIVDWNDLGIAMYLSDNKYHYLQWSQVIALQEE